MVKVATAFVAVMLFVQCTLAQSIAGDWQGTLQAGVVSLRLVLHVAEDKDGHLTATLDSVDQGARGIPVSSITATKNARVEFTVAAVHGTYQGKLSADGGTISGTWTQGQTLPLDLKRAAGSVSLQPRRPQNPTKPYPYREEEVTYVNKPADIRLAGTLTLPPGKGPFPAVLLITGSGPQDRDESLMGHQPFLVLADYLTRKGIAVLRADDRGVGKSGGNFAAATTADFATDAEAGVAYLKSRAEIDGGRIGLIGHSEGGIIAPMVAARSRDVAFIVMMAGSGVPGNELLVEQVRLLNEAAGKSREAVENNVAMEREILALVVREKDSAAFEKAAREKFAGKLPDTVQLKALGSPWFRYFLQYDPATALRQVKCPVLAMNGEKDLQVSPKQNLPAIRRALETGGNKRFEVVELPGLNHLFQTARTGMPTEYAQIEETISPVALDKIASWILHL